MKAWFEQLAPREQRLVLAMAALVLIFLVYSLVWQPLNSNLAKSGEKLARQQALLSWVQENTAKYQQAAKSGARSSSSGSLSGIVNSSARQAGISITRIQPQGEDILIWVDEISFSGLLSWLDNLSTKQGLQVKSIDIVANETSGAVKVRRLQLGRN